MNLLNAINELTNLIKDRATKEFVVQIMLINIRTEASKPFHEKNIEMILQWERITEVLHKRRYNNIKDTAIALEYAIQRLSQLELEEITQSCIDNTPDTLDPSNETNQTIEQKDNTMQVNTNEVEVISTQHNLSQQDTNYTAQITPQENDVVSNPYIPQTSTNEPYEFYVEVYLRNDEDSCDGLGELEEKLEVSLRDTFSAADLDIDELKLGNKPEELLFQGSIFTDSVDGDDEIFNHITDFFIDHEVDEYDYDVLVQPLD